jgi:outer membrane protein assembly factor BamA
MRCRSHLQRCALLFLFILPLAPTAARAQADPPKNFRLSGVIVDGEKKFSQSAIVAASGLVIGKPTSLQDLASAANRLATVGVFKKVRYQYANSADEISVEFHVEEETSLLPCVFDNFIWFKDDELISDLHEHVPFFDVALPSGGDIITQVESELSRLVAAKNDAARVMHIAYSPGMGAAVSAHVFQVSGIALPIRAVHFSGASEKFPSLLAAASKELLDQDYSRLNVRLFATKAYLPIYQERGYLRADFGDSQVDSIVPNSKAGGFEVTVLIPVVEGRIYSWNGATWHGAKIISSDKMNDAVGQHDGAATNLISFNRGIELLQHSYEKLGHVQAAFQVKQTLEDSNSSASFDIGIEEGPQFHMGDLTILGLPPRVGDAVRKAWKLKAGDVYDGTYFHEFAVKDLLAALTRAGAKMASVNSSVVLNQEKDQADVTITFK